MAYLITGGSGFLGFHLARRLLDAEEVVLYDPYISEERVGLIRGKVKIEVGDVSEFADLIRVMKKYDTKKIFHLGYLVPPGSESDPLRAMRVNCQGTANVFEAARLIEAVRVVWPSSVLVYGPKERYDHKILNEDDRTLPPTVYGACKVLNEKLTEHYWKTFGVDAIALRFPVVYGPLRSKGSGYTGIYSTLIENAAMGQGGKAPLADQQFNWVYVKDAVSALLAAMNASKPQHRIFNISGDVKTARELVEILKKMAPSADIEAEAGVFESYHTAYFDTTRAERELGFRPAFTLEKGVMDYIEELKRLTSVQRG